MLGFTAAELAPKLVIMATGDRVVARVTGALGMGAVGAWLAWASRAGWATVGALVVLAVLAAWLAIVAGRPEWQAVMLTMRAAIVVVALWLASYVEHPRMALVVAAGMAMMIVEIALSYALAPGGPGAHLTTVGAAFGSWAPSAVPAVLLALLIWAAWAEILNKARALARLAGLGRPDRR